MRNVVANGIDTFGDDVSRAVPAVDPTLEQNYLI